MASTLITTNADAMKRAARDISSKTDDLSTNQVLNCLSGAIAGPGQNWGFLKGAPTGHYVQAGLPALAAPNPRWLLIIESREPLLYATKAEALDAFSILAKNAENKDEAEKLILTVGHAYLKHFDRPKVRVDMMEVKATPSCVKPIFSAPSARPGQPLTPQIIDRLRGYLASHRNMVIAGATGVGKTTILDELVLGIPERDEVACIETHPELRTPLPNVTKFIAEPKYDGEHRFKLRATLASAARTKPKWFVVGEIAYPGIFTDLVELAITEHCFVGTMHAVSAVDAILHIEHNLRVDKPNRSPANIKKDIASMQLILVCLHHQANGQPARIEVCTVTLDKDEKFVLMPIEL